jgi:2-amino-4-hydroxy-6-hydroxymethyldihydropteridine diphosphokinase
MTPTYIALGSNLLDPLSQLRAAVLALDALPHTQLHKVSSVYRSAAVGPGTQPDYLNAVVLLNTALPPLELLDALQQVERNQHRVRHERWGPRTIDLDLLLYGELTINSARLTIPHPHMAQRHFVLYPLHEISDASLQLPDGTKLAALLHLCSMEGLTKTQFQLTTSRAARVNDSLKEI